MYSLARKKTFLWALAGHRKRQLRRLLVQSRELVVSHTGLSDRLRLTETRLALSVSFIFAHAASKAGRLLQSNAMDERVGMPMHQLPFRLVLAVDLGYAERPVLAGQAANLGLLPLDHHENYEPV